MVEKVAHKRERDQRVGDALRLHGRGNRLILRVLRRRDLAREDCLAPDLRQAIRGDEPPNPAPVIRFSICSASGPPQPPKMSHAADAAPATASFTKVRRPNGTPTRRFLWFGELSTA
jgi:hypothetical protein